MRFVLRLVLLVTTLLAASGVVSAQSATVVAPDAMSAPDPHTPKAERMALLIADARKVRAAASSPAPVAAAGDTFVLLSPYIVRSSRIPKDLVSSPQSALARFQATGKIYESANKRVTLLIQPTPDGGVALAFRLPW